MPDKHYLLGGEIRDRDAYVYIPRTEDETIFSALWDGQPSAAVALSGCHQSGKSSLAHAACDRLAEEGWLAVRCDSRNLVHGFEPGRDQLTAFWCDLFTELWRETGEGAAPLTQWLEARLTTGRKHEWNLHAEVQEFFRDFLPGRFPGRPIVIFIDEMDAFAPLAPVTEALFSAIEKICLTRGACPVRFLLVGTNKALNWFATTPASKLSLIKPFQLWDFKVDSRTAAAWTTGLGADYLDAVRVFLRAASGQPALMAHLCDRAAHNSCTDSVGAEALVDHFAEDVRRDLNSHAHFRTHSDQILAQPMAAWAALETYRRILRGDEVLEFGAESDQSLLILAGLVMPRGGRLAVKSPIYQRVFDERWINLIESQLGTRHQNRRPGGRRAGPRKLLCVINAGGTLGMEPKPDGRMGAPDNPAKFFTEFAEMGELADIEALSLTPKDGSNMTPQDWASLATAIFDRNDRGFSGFVVVHGTDTLAYTAAAVAYALGPWLKYPVVFTGSQAPNNIIHGDARANIARACRVALETDLSEVVVCFNDTVHRAVRVEKQDDFRFDGFHSPSFAPLAFIGEKIEFAPGSRDRPWLKDRTGDWMLRPWFDTRVFRISQFPGLRPEYLDLLLEQSDVHGVLIETLGIGNLPTIEGYSLITFIERAVDRGIPVVISSRYPIQSEFVPQYTPAIVPIQKGAIPAGNMTPAAAMTKLMWVLGAAMQETPVPIRDRKFITRVSEKFRQSYVGEVEATELLKADQEKRLG